MSEPIIPSGRDYDAGLASGDRPVDRKSLLHRIATKLSKKRVSKVHEYDLRLDPQVAQRQSFAPAQLDAVSLPSQPSRAQPVAAEELRQAEVAEPSPIPEQVPRLVAESSASQIKRRPAPSTADFLEAQLPGGCFDLAAWLLIANPDACGVLTVDYYVRMASACGDSMVANLVRWRLSAATGQDGIAGRSHTEEAAKATGLPPDVADVLHFLATHPISFTEYRDGVGLAAGKAAALAPLISFCRDYPSAEPILHALTVPRILAPVEVDVLMAAMRTHRDRES